MYLCNTETNKQKAMKATEIKKCPLCGSEHIEWMGGEYEPNEWHCHECDSWFSKDDAEHQLYWENISCLLNGTSIEEQFVLNTPYILPSVDEESQGLSESEKLSIDRVHQIEGDGKMYYHFEHTPDTDDYWYDMYELSTKDLKGLLEHIREDGGEIETFESEDDRDERPWDYFKKSE